MLRLIKIIYPDIQMSYLLWYIVNMIGGKDNEV